MNILADERAGDVIIGFKLGVAQQNTTEIQFVVDAQLDAVDLVKSDLAKK